MVQPLEGGAAPAAPEAGAGKAAVVYTRVEKACRLLGQVSLLVLIAVVSIDILTRSVFNYSFEVADELGGYLLVCIAFFSLSVCQAHDGFHRVEFVMDRLSARSRLVALMVYDLAALALAALLVWFLWSFVSAGWASGNTAPTRLATPLWIAQVPMVLGLLAYILSLGGSLSRNIQALRTWPARQSEAPHGN